MAIVARMWRGRTPESRSDEYLDYLIKTGVKDIRATEGHRGVLLLRRAGQGEAEFLMISLWESLAAIRRSAGNELDKAVYYPRDKEYLLALEPTVTHYEVVVAP